MEEEEDEEEEDEEARTESPPSGSGDVVHFPESEQALVSQTSGQLEGSVYKRTETTPLLARSTSRSKSRRRRTLSEGPHGDATVLQAVLMVCFCHVNALNFGS